MDSLTLYLSCREKYLCNPSMAGHKLDDIDTIIRQVCKEIFDSSVDLEGSPFICEVENMLRQMKLWNRIFTTKIYVQDAYVIILGLVEYLKNSNFTATQYFNGYDPYVFSNIAIEGAGMNQITMIKYYLNLLGEKIRSRKSAYGTRKNGIPEVNKTQTPPSRDVAQKAAMAVEAEKLLKKMEMRIEQNKINIQLWHDEQAGISAKLIEMQPSVSRLLENFMTFSDNITEQYVLQFAKMQIELFNLIFDGYTYHEKKSETSKNQDYMNATLNYEDFMYSIIDHLAVFGVEEITSDPKTRFDGVIHEPDTDSFSPKTALVKKSIRTGFRYKDIILQKEKVQV